MTRRPRRDHRSRERGSLTVMVIGFTAIAGLLLGLVVVATHAYLTRRALVSYADGAAVTAAQAVSATGVYEQGLADTVPLDAALARSSVAEFVATSGLSGRFDGFTVVDVSLTRAGVVRVVLGAVAPVPFAHAVTGDSAAGVPIEVEATAEAQLQP